MNILVCIKQVPDTTAIKIDPVKHTLIRDGVPSIVSTFDAYALEVASRMKDKDKQSRITVLSMGPEQAKNALKECISKGADEAYLVSDRVFGGSDTLATSYILSGAIKMLEEKNGAPFDLIFCGKQAIDGDTGQVGPEIAQHLDRALLTYASDAVMEDGKLKVKRESDEGYDYLTADLPAVITVVKTAYEPRYPSLKGKMAANKAVIPTLTSQDLSGLDLARCGLKGSPTKVRGTFTPTHEKNGQKIEAQTGDEAGRTLVKLLGQAKLIG